MEDKIGELGTCLDGIKQSIKDGEYIELSEKLKELRELQKHKKIPVKCWKHTMFYMNKNLEIIYHQIDDVVLAMTQEDYNRVKHFAQFSMCADEAYAVECRKGTHTITPHNFCIAKCDEGVNEFNRYYTLKIETPPQNIMGDKIGEIGNCLDDIKQNIKDGEYIELYDKLKELRDVQETREKNIPVKCWKHMLFCVDDNSIIYHQIDAVILPMTQTDYDTAKRYPLFSMNSGGYCGFDGGPFTIHIPNDDVEDIYEFNWYYTLRHD